MGSFALDFLDVIGKVSDFWFLYPNNFRYQFPIGTKLFRQKQLQSFSGNKSKLLNFFLENFYTVFNVFAVFTNDIQKIQCKTPHILCCID